MISRIVILPLILPLSTFIVCAFSAESVTAEVFQVFDQDSILSQNLEQELDSSDITRIRRAIDAQERITQLTSESRTAFAIAKGLLAMAEASYQTAVERFASVPKASLLYDASLYYRAKALRLSGERFLDKGEGERGHSNCSMARKWLASLADYTPSPFEDLRQKEYPLTTLCLAKALIAQKRLVEAKKWLLLVLETVEVFHSSDQEALLISFLEALRIEGNLMEARRLARDVLDWFPKNRTLKAYASKAPPVLVSLPKAEVEEIPLVSKKERPEDILYQKANRLYKKGKSAEAVKQFLKIVEDYPGSVAAKKMGPRVKIIVERYISQKGKPPGFVSLLKSLPPKDLYEVAKSLWLQGFHASSSPLLKHLIKAYPQTLEAGKAVYVMGRVYEDQRKWSHARKYFEILIHKYSTSIFYDNAHFKIGWLSYLTRDYDKALKWLEYDRAKAIHPTTKSKDLYWLSKTYEAKGNLAESKRYRDQVQKITPISYYAFLTDYLPVLHDVGYPTRSAERFWNRYYIRRAKAFLSAGLHTAAARIFSQIDFEQEPQIRVFVAKLYDAAHQHRFSILTLSDVFYEDPNVLLSKALFSSFFPLPFKNEIFFESKKNQLDPLLVYSLIRQESAFQKDAKSRAGALGLMQLLPSTGRQVAREMGKKLSSEQELVNSALNVKLGTHYLNSLIQRYKGNIVYALAAYNAGPHRMDMWEKHWKDLPMEHFIELIPLTETRNYVKFIIRNYANYAEFVEKRKIKLSALSKRPLE